MNITQEAKSILYGIVRVAIGLGLVFVGGWAPIWQRVSASSEPLLISIDGVAVRINSRFYGAEITYRFFDSPVLSWVCLGAALGITPVFIIFFGDTSE